MRTVSIFLLASAFAFAPAVASASDLLVRLANCDSMYFQILKGYTKEIESHGVNVVVAGEVARIIPPDRTDIAYSHAEAKPPITIDGMEVSGFVDGVVMDDVDGSIQYVWGVSTPAPVDEVAGVINGLLPSDREAVEVHEDMYLRSEYTSLANRGDGWKGAPLLRYGTPPKGIVAKGLIVDRVLSIDNIPAEGRTWVTCNLHGLEIPPGVLADERPDLAR